MSSVELAKLKPNELLGLYSEIMEVLRRRGVVRSSNNPVGDFAENLAAKALGLKKVALSTKGFDACDDKGMTYEIKSRRLTEYNTSRQLSAIRKLDEKHFDFLVGVLFNADFSVNRACVMPYEVAKEIATYREHTNAWIIQLRDEVWQKRGVLDVTTVFRQLAES